MKLAARCAIVAASISSIVHYSAALASIEIDNKGNSIMSPPQQQGKRLADEPLHLGLGATTTSLTKITGMEWYEQYSRDTESDGNDGRLVSMYTFTEPWDVWEMHPVGEECVICTAGTVTVIQEMEDGTQVPTVLNAGDYVVNPMGVWHTADCSAQCTVLFITPGRGTQHKPREKQATSK